MFLEKHMKMEPISFFRSLLNPIGFPGVEKVQNYCWVDIGVFQSPANQAAFGTHDFMSHERASVTTRPFTTPCTTQSLDHGVDTQQAYLVESTKLM